MILKGKHLSIYVPTGNSARQSTNKAMKSKELSIDLRDWLYQGTDLGKGTDEVLQH